MSYVLKLSGRQVIGWRRRSVTSVIKVSAVGPDTPILITPDARHRRRPRNTADPDAAGSAPPSMEGREVPINYCEVTSV